MDLDARRITLLLAAGLPVAAGCGDTPSSGRAAEDAVAPVAAPVSSSADGIIDLPGEDRALKVNAEQLFVGHVNPDGWRVLGPANRWLRSWRVTYRPGQTRTSSDVRLGFDAEGHLYVLDPGTWRMYVVDPEGTLLREFGVAAREVGRGRRSSAPARLGVGPDGGVLVCEYDAEECRVYSTDGELEQAANFGDYEGPAGITDHFRSARSSTAFFTLMDPGGAWVVERTVLEDSGAETTGLANVWSPPERPRGAGGSEGSTMGILLRSGSPDSVTATVSPGHPFLPMLRYDALPGGGFAFVDSTGYVVKLASADGRVHRTIRRPLVPRPISEEMRAAERRQLHEGAESLANDFPEGRQREAVASALRDAVEEMYFHDEMAVVRNLVSTWEGGVWVQRSGEDPDGDGGPIDVLAPDGSYVGTIDTKDSGRLLSTLHHGRVAFGPNGLVAFVEDAPQEGTFVVLKRLPPEVR